MRRLCVLATLLAALSFAVVPTADGGRRPAMVFDFVGGDGEFAYSITLSSDRRWVRSEHSGHASGRLTPRAMRRFLALLAKAPLQAATTTCSRPGFAVYRDGVRHRELRVESSCQDAADDATARLPGCLELFTDGSEASLAACPLD